LLAKRILTAIIGILAALYIVNFGQWLFAAAIIILALAAWLELSNMLRNKDIKVSNIVGIIAILVLLGCALYGNSQETIAVLALSMLCVMAQTVLAYPAFSLTDAAFTLLGISYIGVLFSYLILLRFLDVVYISTWFGIMPAGAAYLWLAFIGTWFSDTFAFFVGSKFGKRKLCPLISPAKTLEGSVGGLIGSMIGVALMGLSFHFPIQHSLIIGLLIGITAPLGDLAESAIKRFTGVKDSGRLLPGHGGVLDRFDSVLFAGPMVYYYLLLFVIS